MTSGIHIKDLVQKGWGACWWQHEPVHKRCKDTLSESATDTCTYFLSSGKRVLIHENTLSDQWSLHHSLPSASQRGYVPVEAVDRLSGFQPKSCVKTHSWFVTEGVFRALLTNLVDYVSKYFIKGSMESLGWETWCLSTAQLAKINLKNGVQHDLRVEWRGRK